MIDLTINPDLTIKILTGFIKTELNRVGFKRTLMGVSGGIDSAVSLYLSAKALGPENVLAVRMPYRTSPQDTLEDAQAMIDDLGVQSMTVEITEMVDPLINHYENMTKLRAGNIMARMRMIVLYDQSVPFKGLVMGTSNKTEMLLGYSTIFGDSAVALQPIGDLYKTQVRQLAKALGVPDKVIQKAPSADLWAGQTDEGELGFTYAEVDKLLYLLVDQRYRPEDCVEEGFDQAFVERVMELMRRNHFKRVMPPIAKLSQRTIGYDFLYLRDWGT
ncbi:MAG: NH(3)-dependent NAD(+) synthetase [Anaerolineaceae bacterium 46_22]|nr:MAG: NH(3)-dependent NAD(+) synthetase [Anaerolineaceae bacterium 46_22]